MTPVTPNCAECFIPTICRGERGDHCQVRFHFGRGMAHESCRAAYAFQKSI